VAGYVVESIVKGFRSHLKNQVLGLLGVTLIVCLACQNQSRVCRYQSDEPTDNFPFARDSGTIGQSPLVD
jgi:hypothetical protein